MKRWKRLDWVVISRSWRDLMSERTNRGDRHVNDAYPTACRSPTIRESSTYMHSTVYRPFVPIDGEVAPSLPCDAHFCAH